MGPSAPLSPSPFSYWAGRTICRICYWRVAVLSSAFGASAPVTRGFGAMHRDWLERMEGLVFRALNGVGIENRIAILHAYNRIKFGRKDRMRRRLRPELLQGFDPSVIMDDGWAIDRSRSVPHLASIGEICRALLSERPGEIGGNVYLSNIFHPNDFSSYPLLFDFATSPQIVSVAAAYLDQIPVLSQMFLWRSRPYEALDGSQLFHKDQVDSQQAKVFVLLRDVGPGDGPLTFVPRRLSADASRQLGYGRAGADYRVRDDALGAYVSEEDWLIFTGVAGDIAYVDTSSCFHFGSRIKHGERHMLMLQYTRLTRGDVRRPPFADYVSTGDSELKKLVLDPFYRVGM